MPITILDKRMLEGNLNWEYAKLYPRKDSEFMPKFTLTKQDSIRLKLIKAKTNKSKDTVKK